MEAVVVNELPRVSMPGRSKFVGNLVNNGIKLADPTMNSDFVDISILIGADQYYNYVYNDNKLGDVSMIPSKFGLLMSGPLKNKLESNSSINSVTVLKVCTEESLDTKLDKFWNLDFVDNKTNNIKQYQELENYRDCVR